MADIFTTEKRSEVMSRIRGRNTKPEIAVRSMLHAHGYRFTVNGPKNRKLPGRPDIVLPKHRTVIFVHGCFWHGHEGCKDFRIPKTRVEFWKNKIFTNRARDIRSISSLKELGWKPIVIWTCEMKTVPDKETLRDRLPALIELEPTSFGFNPCETKTPAAAEEANIYRA
ncbi:MAG: very short patch repair endonuclease [Akkermansiaceae bacterium]